MQNMCVLFVTLMVPQNFIFIWEYGDLTVRKETLFETANKRGEHSFVDVMFDMKKQSVRVLKMSL